MGNFLTSSQVGCFAAPEWVLTFNLPQKTILILNLKLFNNNRNGFKNQTKLQGGVRGLDQQADQHGVLRQLRVHVHVHLLRQDDVAYSGMAAFFKKSSDEEREHGEKLIKYQNKRGGKVVFQDIAKPSSMEWGTPLDALEAALELEKTVNQSLLDLHKASDGDAHLCDFLEGEFLGEQVDAIKEISGWITKMKRAGPGIGFHLIDKEIGS